jgi:hypothetical protein
MFTTVSRIDIFQQVETERVVYPFRLIETFLCADGPRTRVCDGQWRTLQDAVAAKQAYEALRK